MPKKKKAVVPRLRFPEFRDAGPWEVKRLSEFVQQKAGNSKFIKGKLFSEPAHDRFPGFSASGQDVWLDDFEHSGKAIIVSAVGARCGRCFLADGKWSAIANTHILFPDMSQIDIRFLFEMVTREGFWIISGSGQPFVKVRDSLEQRVPLPSLPEQQKIADCLSSLDELIRAEEAALETLKRHKKGLMQQLFPREGETTPRLRFPEFRDAGPWEVKRLGEVADVYQPETISQSLLSDDGEFLVYGANGIIGRFDRYNHEEPQIAITCRGSTCGEVTLTQPRSWITGNSMVVNVENSKDVLRGFLYYQLKGTDWRYLITGSGQPQITGEIKKHKVTLPSHSEQQKIADCLSSLDELIRAKANRIEALTSHKRGLMQQLFPQEVC